MANVENQLRGFALRLDGTRYCCREWVEIVVILVVVVIVGIVSSRIVGVS